MTLLTRRSLLRVGALSPLIIPGRSLARVGGAPAVVAQVCGGSPLTVPSNGVINTPGCYALTADMITGAPGLNIQVSNVTVVGNGHTVNGGITLGVFAGTATGISIQDIVTNTAPIQIYGNTSATQTPPAVHLKGITLNNNSQSYGIIIQNNNVLVENCTLNTGYTVAGSSGIDDCIAAGGQSVISRYCTFDTVMFGSNFDVGLEGLGTWDHFTVKNCTSIQGLIASFGGYYSSIATGSQTTSFAMTNCAFQSNTVEAASAWYFPDASNNLVLRNSDAAANAQWGGASGNVFGGSGALANNYVTLTREECERRAALFAQFRRHPPPGPPRQAWDRKITCR